MPGPGTWLAGDILTAADLNAIGTWTTYTPTVTQNGTRTATINYASYCLINTFCIVNVDLTITNAGALANLLTVSSPQTISGATITRGVGAGLFYDASATDVMLITVARAGTSTFKFYTDATTSNNDGLGTNPSLAVANGDGLSFYAAFETA